MKQLPGTQNTSWSRQLIASITITIVFGCLSWLIMSYPNSSHLYSIGCIFRFWCQHRHYIVGSLLLPLPINISFLNMIIHDDNDIEFIDIWCRVIIYLTHEWDLDFINQLYEKLYKWLGKCLVSPLRSGKHLSKFLEQSLSLGVDSK